MRDIRQEFQRVFEFVVKHGVHNPSWTNATTKRFLRWAWDKRRLLVIYDGEGPARRIAAAAVVWRTDHPENRYDDYSDSNVMTGDYLSVYQVIVHPQYRRRGCLILLLTLAISENPGVTRIFWNSHGRNHRHLRITDIATLGKELSKWDYPAAIQRHQTSPR